MIKLDTMTLWKSNYRNDVIIKGNVKLIDYSVA